MKTLTMFLVALLCAPVVRFSQHPLVKRGWATLEGMPGLIDRWFGFDGPRFLGANAGMVRVPVKAKTFGQLAAEAGPQIPGQPEAIPWVFYDTQAFTGTTTRLTFFQVTNTDLSITNMVNAGQLPHPQSFQWFYWGLDVLHRPSTAAGGTTGAIDDIAQLVLSGRGRATFTLQDKTYGPFPLSFLHASGGPTGFGWGTFTAEESIQYSNNAVFDGGYCWNGAIIIPSKVGFNVVLEWPAALTLTTDPLNLRVWMYGLLNRAVK